MLDPLCLPCCFAVCPCDRPGGEGLAARLSLTEQAAKPWDCIVLDSWVCSRTCLYVNIYYHRMYISATCIAWVCPLSSSVYRRLSLIPRLRPALHHLQYGKAERACYLFSREHNVINKWQKRFRIKKKRSFSTNLQGLSGSHLSQGLSSSRLPQGLKLSPPSRSFQPSPPSVSLKLSPSLTVSACTFGVVCCSDTLTALCDSVSEDCGVRTSQE